MGKPKKKLSKRFKRTIWIALSGLFLLSSIGVALLPERNVDAYTKASATKEYLPDDTRLNDGLSNKVPVITASDKIYSTGDGMFQFAYITKANGDKIAVLCGYDSDRTLPTDPVTHMTTLEIPQTVDAYKKITDSQGTKGGYGAVSKSDEALYYPISFDETTGLPTDFLPCYYSTYDLWINDENGVPRDVEDYYYLDATSGDFVQTTDPEHQRVAGAEVCYIANQRVVLNTSTASGSSDWTLVPLDPSDESKNLGVFSGAGNMQSVIISSSILGIGNYAFKDCACLEAITFNNGLNTIGNRAFEGCVNLKTVTIPQSAAIKVLGERAFYDCEQLTSFNMPINVQVVGDSCFEDCFNMTECVLTYPGASVKLSKMGNNVFKGCRKLEYIEFPETYKEDQVLSWFDGCDSLKYIKMPYAQMKFIDSYPLPSSAPTTSDFDSFKSQRIEEFYIEGVQNSDLHSQATANSIAFKFLNEETYEKVFNNGTGDVVYRVDNQNKLKYFDMDPNATDITIPTKIGPYEINKIGEDCFKYNEDLSMITIPSSITEIEKESFKGCYNLENVLFSEPINVAYIGADAFDTQEVAEGVTVPINTPFLAFTGVAEKDSVPFRYAMNMDTDASGNQILNNINNRNQPETYILFYTGWPSNLEIQYNKNTGENELISIPTKDMVEFGTFDYPYLTSEMKSNARTAFSATDPTGYQSEIIDAIKNIEIPNGVTAFKEDLFTEYNPATQQYDVNAPDVLTITADGIESLRDSEFEGMTNLKSATFNNSCETIGDYAFKDCSNLQTVSFNDKTKKIGDYAFLDCINLESVSFNAPIDEIGSVPFLNCVNLKDKKDSDGKLISPCVDFTYDGDTVNYPAFTEKDLIIFGLDCNKNLQSIIEVLPARGSGADSYSSTIIADELQGVKSVASEALKNCENISEVDFSKTSIETIPSKCFENTTGLSKVTLDDKVVNVAENAFENSEIRKLVIPSARTLIDPLAFNGVNHTVTLRCEEGSAAQALIKNYPNDFVYEKEPHKYKVSFYLDMNDLSPVKGPIEVEEGTDANTIAPTVTKEGYVFESWGPRASNIQGDTDLYAVFVPKDEVLYKVEFLDWDDTVLSTQKVKPGEDCIPIKEPTREGYVFAGWRPGITNIQKDTTVFAQYEKSSDSNIPGGGNNNGENGGNGNNGQNGSNAKLYTLTVVGGSGSGSYVAGASVVICANNPQSGQVFDKWTHDEEVKIVKDDIAATYFIMPEKDVSVSATYKTDTTKKNENNNSGGTNNNANTVTKPNTTVSLTKTGFSNNGLASATVGGSSDNFILKITDSQTAKAEIEDALLTEYGSLDNIKYVAMDISLYDSTGSAKIQNTDDLNVSITLPIPDDLVPYAGNNKVACVVNGKLVKLNPKFTTINGVSCMNFVASHFSPYTIYVDTTDLSSSVTFSPTSTPKTGDGLSVKWVISLGLLAMSVFFFALCIPTGKKKKVK